ncbi:MAG: glycoside hydrolase family 36 N-terminal domain-containing protein [Oscillospiraceae bacterium]
MTLQDKLAGLAVLLSYTVFDCYNSVFRSVGIPNISNRPFRLTTALSANIDFYRDDLEAIYLAGAWARERHIKRQLPQQATITTVTS